jgi:hypothetical protein
MHWGILFGKNTIIDYQLVMLPNNIPPGPGAATASGGCCT